MTLNLPVGIRPDMKEMDRVTTPLLPRGGVFISRALQLSTREESILAAGLAATVGMVAKSVATTHLGDNAVPLAYMGMLREILVTPALLTVSMAPTSPGCFTCSKEREGFEAALRGNPELQVLLGTFRTSPTQGGYPIAVSEYSGSNRWDPNVDIHPDIANQLIPLLKSREPQKYGGLADRDVLPRLFGLKS